MPSGPGEWAKFLGARLVGALTIALAIFGAVVLLPDDLVKALMPITAYWAPGVAVLAACVMLYLHKETPGFILKWIAVPVCISMSLGLAGMELLQIGAAPVFDLENVISTRNATISALQTDLAQSRIDLAAANASLDAANKKIAALERSADEKPQAKHGKRVR